MSDESVVTAGCRVSRRPAAASGADDVDVSTTSPAAEQAVYSRPRDVPLLRTQVT